MALEATRTNLELATLRIERPQEQPRRKRSRLGSISILMLLKAVLGAASYVIYARTLGRPQTVQTIMVLSKGAGQPGVVLTGSGYVVTRQKYITIGTKILGQIVAEPIEEGQHVRIGDVLAQIDDRDYQAQLRQAAAVRDLSASNLRLDLAKAERARHLFGIGVISKDEYETAMNAAEVAQAALQRDTAAVDYAKFEVSQCVITSPINGIVLRKYRELGDTINYGGDIQAGGGATDIAQLADTTDMRTEVDINEADIAKVTMGQPAAVIPDAYPDKSFAAFVAKIYPEADRLKGTVKVEVKLRDPDLRIIKPEMSAKVTFMAVEGGPNSVRASAPLVIVPKKAIVTDGAASAVWVVRDDAAYRVAITTGREFQDGIEVRSGLAGGELVIVEPPADLKAGSRVTTTAP